MTNERDSSDPHVQVVGLGRVGLPTAAILADRGVRVHGVDVDLKRLAELNAASLHIDEPGLGAIVHRAIDSARLTFGHEPGRADVHILALPTPLSADGKADLSALRSAVHRLDGVLGDGDLVLIESTVPVGTTRGLGATLRGFLEPGRRCSVAYAPERVLPGRTLAEIDGPRLVGGVDAESSRRARDFYLAHFGPDVETTDAETAELTKLAENASRSVELAFANELARLCRAADRDVWTVRSLANRHPRVHILRPGPGVGGHCVPVDPHFLAALDPGGTVLLDAAARVHDQAPRWALEQIRDRLRLLPDRPLVACLGVTYKADVDDLRCSPSLSIALELAQEHEVCIVDPYLSLDGNQRGTKPPGLAQISRVSLGDATQRADLLVALVRHREFFERRSSLPRERTLDLCGLWAD